MSIDEWAAWAETLALRMDSHFATEDELNATLNEAVSHPSSPVTRAIIEIHARGQLVLKVDVGVGDDQGLETTTRLEGGEDDKVHVSVIPKRPLSSLSMEEQQKVTSSMNRLVDGFWKAHYRDSHAALPSRDVAGCPKLIEASTPFVLASRPYLSSMFIDIDGFHELNRQLGEHQGDLIIGRIGRLIASVAGPSALAIRRSGDEFIVLAGVESQEDALRAARNLMDGVAMATFPGAPGVSVRVSVGVALASANQLFDSVDELNKLAEQALVEDGKKHHGTARMARSGETFGPPQALDLWLCQVTAGASNPRPFNNAWLNLLSEDVAVAVSKTGTTEIGRVVEDFVAWALPTWSEGLGVESDSSEPTFSPMEAALAVAHGVLRGGLQAPLGSDSRLWLAHSSLLNCVEVRLGDDSDPLVRLGGIMVGSPVESPIVDQRYMTQAIGGTPIDCRRGVLLAVGRGQVPVPESLFREVIRVDDRPTRQGGLPDFWAAALAQLIGRCEQSPNVTAVFVLGDRDHAHETVKWIEKRADWAFQAERLTRKTGVTPRALQAAAQQLNQVTFCNSGDELLAAVHATQRSGGSFLPESDLVSGSSRRLLRREVRAELFRLPEAAGCRVDCVADAYPVVLDRMRSADRSVYQVRDEAGLNLVEFRDFVIKVDEVGAEKVPQAYLDDAEDLENYYRAEFLEVGGTFTASLKGQADVVVAGLRSVLQRAPASTTRRAVLVVTHDISSGEMNPLGLVAVRLAPRSVGPVTYLDFSFIWRTVEAVVGLPYSLYGSARYAEELRDRISMPPAALEIGSLTYIALSLHMRLDDYSQQVARRVVEDASE